MKEAAFDITKELYQGLRPDVRDGRKSNYLVDLFNLVPTIRGLEPWEKPIDPFVGTVISWPFPQLIRGDHMTFRLTGTTIAEVNESVVPWTSAAISTFDPAIPANAKAITAGGVWHLADFMNSWYLFNGSCVVFRTGLDLLNEDSVKTYVQDAVTITTGCEFKGRTILGGFDPANFWQTALSNIFDTWGDEVAESIGRSIQDIGPNWVAWSSIGGGDLPFLLFHPAGYTYNFAPSASRLLDIFRRNEAGWMPMPFQGRVLCIKPLGDRVIVYGEDGIVALTPTGGGGGVPPTFGRDKIAPIGIPQRGAVGGDKTAHVFVDTEGDLWRLTGQGIQRLGYKEYLSTLLDEEIVVSMDTKRRRFFIGSNTNGFVLDNGLGKVKTSITSCDFVQGGLVGYTNDFGLDTATILTNEFDVSIRGIKTITYVLVNAVSAFLLECRVWYRFEKDAAWAQGDWVPFNAEGAARVQTSGVDFRVEIRGADYTDLYLDYIQVAFQVSDKRFHRHPYIDTPASRQG